MSDPLDKLSPQKPSADIASALRPIRNRKWLIIGMALAIPTGVGILVSKQAKLYQATASMVVEVAVPQYMGAAFKDVVETEPSWWSSRETMETEFRVLRSRSQATAVAKALCDVKIGSDGGPALRYLVHGATCAPGATHEYEAAAEQIQNALRVDPVRESRLVLLTATFPNPDFAAALANTVAQVYVDHSLERRLSHSAGAATWLGGEYEVLMRQLRSAEDALVAFKQPE
jgi:succinoglycan biosynthesis transport protein ExoP